MPRNITKVDSTVNNHYLEAYKHSSGWFVDCSIWILKLQRTPPVWHVCNYLFQLVALDRRDP